MRGHILRSMSRLQTFFQIDRIYMYAKSHA